MTRSGCNCRWDGPIQRKERLKFEWNHQIASTTDVKPQVCGKSSNALNSNSRINNVVYNNLKDLLTFKFIGEICRENGRQEKERIVALNETSKIVTEWLRATPTDKLHFRTGIAPPNVRCEVAANRERCKMETNVGDLITTESNSLADSMPLPFGIHLCTK